jgi:predicted kinase
MERIFEMHLKKFKYLAESHEKFVICFSGIAGSGKTHIAKILEERYNGIRIRNDDIRQIILGLDAGVEDLDKVTYEYGEWFFRNNNFQNGLIIVDSGIDRRYGVLFPFFEEKRYKIFVIRLDVPIEVCERRVIERSGKLDNNYISRIEGWQKQHKKFGENFESDIVINNECELNLDELFSKLDKLIN